MVSTASSYPIHGSQFVPKRGDPTASSVANAGITWKKCLQAPGFDGPFLDWWRQRKLAPNLRPGEIEESLTPAQATQVFATMKEEVKKFETALIAHRTKGAKQKRITSMKYVLLIARPQGRFP